MLLGQDLGGRHERDLVLVLDGDDSRFKGDNGLA